MKIGRSISLDKEKWEWLDSIKDNVSEYINGLVGEKMNPTLPVLVNQFEEMIRQRDEFDKRLSLVEEDINKVMETERIQRDAEELRARKKIEESKKVLLEERERMIATISKLNGIDLVVKEFQEKQGQADAQWLLDKVNVLRTLNPSIRIDMTQLREYLYSL